MATLAAFYETRDTLSNYINYTEPLSFDEWKATPDDQKAAALYLQFFNEITLAWNKANSYDFINGEEGVETALQYLQKLVCDRYIKGHPKKKVSSEYFHEHRDECEERRLIEENPTNFYAGFIYKVMYNALYCICHDPQSVKDKWDYETSSIVNYKGEELCLFDNLADPNGSATDVSDSATFENEFWSVIETTGVKAEKVMRYLLSGDESDLKKLSSKSKNYKVDPLRDVEVSAESIEPILGHLRKKFMDLPHNSPCGEYVMSMLATAS